MKVRIFWFFFALLLLFSVYAWIDITNLDIVGFSYLIITHRLMAVIGFVFIFMQFITSSRLKLFEEGFGLSRMIAYHRNFGRIGLFIITLHPILFLTFMAIVVGSVRIRPFLWIGIISLIGFFITAMFALFHKKWGVAYKVWINIHRANYFIFPFVLIHVFMGTSPGSLLYYLWIAFALAFIAIIIRKLYLIVHARKKAAEVKQEAE